MLPDRVLPRLPRATRSGASAHRRAVFPRPLGRRPPYSHSIVAGGLELMSYTTRLTPGTSFTIRELIVPSTS
jgi:hypothetical protein